MIYIIICQILAHWLRGYSKKIENTKALTIDNFVLGRNQTKKLTERRCTFLCQRWYFLISPMQNLMGSGCSRIIYLFELNIDWGIGTTKGYFFHPSCDVYWYPCVRCCLEPVNVSSKQAIHKSTKSVILQVHPYILWCISCHISIW